MRTIKKIFRNINKKDFIRYGLFSVLLLVTMVVIRNTKFTQARYESSALVNITPTIAFFIVDVQSQSGQIRLDDIIPSTTPYLYSFNVSNFDTAQNKRANVDLTYSIEIIATTNIPLNYRIYKGNNMNQNVVSSDTTTTDANGVYYRHLVINGVSTMSKNTNQTDVYTLWVEFPLQFKDSPASYSGIIELIDIKIDAEQVV